MKKTLSINLNGRAFNIDEDAFELLDNYLHNLKLYFRKEADSAEIIRDFEARIEELFQERIRLGYNVISIEQVETIIERMGKPEDFGNEGFESKESDTCTKKESEIKDKPKKRFYRNVDDKRLGGVCSGIAAYFGWDSLSVRVVFILLIFFSKFFIISGFIIPVYIVLWILMPAAVTAGQKLEMRGEAVTLENIGKTVSETTTTASNNGCLATSLKFGIGCLGCLIGIPLFFALSIVFIVLIALIFGFSSALFYPLNFLGFDGNIISGTHPIIGIIALIFVLGIPLFSIIYALFFANKKVRPINKTTKWAGLLIWIIALIVLISSGFKLNKEFCSNYPINWNIPYCNVKITGSGEIADRRENLPSFSTLKIDDNLIATVRIRQGNNPKILISGDNNIIDKVKWEIDNNNEELKLGISEPVNLKNDLTVAITTPKISGIKMGALNKVSIDNKIETPDFNLKVEGAGSFYADSLYTANLVCKMKGVGKVYLGGKAKKAYLRLRGAGEIDAYALETDSLTAQLEGVGAIRCNPVDFLKASLDGVGNITYKEEPKFKQVSINGVGKLKKE
ncbi:MAG: DUF2807 domain-containing protein [Candidatus Azobacteroides sp.]|nr:DUF2807 domain-containing protein [Candidatus Azobacteroides sp.]